MKTHKLLLISLLVFTASSSISCKKKDDDKRASMIPNTGAPAAPSSITNPLFTQVPTEANGFLEWDLSTAAYKKLNSSPWSGSQEIAMFKSGTSADEMEVVRALRKVGLDPAQRSTWESLCERAVVYTVKRQSTESTPLIALRCQGSVNAKIEEVVSALKTELKSTGKNFKEEPVGKGEAFSFELKDSTPASSVAAPTAIPPTTPDGTSTSAKTEASTVTSDTLAQATTAQTAKALPVRVYFGHENKDTLITLNANLLKQAFSGTSNAIPALVSSEGFKAATTGFPDSSSRFILGYLDVASVVNALSSNFPEMAQDLAKIPFNFLSFSGAMDQAPTTELRAAYNSKDESQKGWFDALGSSLSSAVLNSAPKSPIAFLSIDGQTVKKLIEKTFPEQKQEDLAKFSEMLGGITRIGLTGKLAPLGQSMLPLPELLIALETTDAEKVKIRLKELAGAGLSKNGMPSQWTDKQIGKDTVSFALTPLGLGVFVASKGNNVLVASTESQITDALQLSSAFTTSLPNRIGSALQDEQTVASIYVNFEQVASFMETLGGTLSMYAPQDSGAAQSVNQENIAAIRKMGLMVGAIKVESGVISWKSFYEEMPKQVASN